LRKRRHYQGPAHQREHGSAASIHLSELNQSQYSQTLFRVAASAYISRRRHRTHVF
jgi:hypothetical protein